MPDAAGGPVDRVSLGRREGRERWLIEHAGRQLAVLVVDEEVVVLDAACPHRGGPLVEGIVRDGALVCPWHWYTFDLRTGRCRTATMTSVGRYDVVVEGDELYALVPPGPPERTLAEILRAHARSGGGGGS